MIRAAPGFALATLLAVAACTGGSREPAPPRTAQAACKLAPSPDTLLSLAACCAETLSNNPSCRAYDREHGYVIVKDNAPDKLAAYLIIPVGKVTGIEDPQAVQYPVVNFWQYAWDTSRRLPGAPPFATALAINSVRGRTQNQLHIHIACVRPDVAAALARVDVAPTRLRLGPAGHPYELMRLQGLSGDQSPFLRVAGEIGGGQDMANTSIAIIGTALPGVYDLLETKVEPGNPGSAEELLDQSCTAIRNTPPPTRPG